MDKHEVFTRIVLDILVSSKDWNGDTVVKIANLANLMGFAIGGTADGGYDFELVLGDYTQLLWHNLENRHGEGPRTSDPTY